MQRQLFLPGEIIKKSNAIARARWSPESVLELRLVAILASKVHINDVDFQVYEIPVKEVLRGASGKAYQEIIKIVDRVMSRVLTIHDENGWTKYNVFSRCRYRKKEGMLELGFHPDLIPHYLNLQRNFLQYNKFEYLTLSSIYSKRIFEILKSWDDKPEVILSLADLHEMLDTPESLRSKYINFKARVLEKAHKDIIKTSLYYEWEAIKKGRAVVAIRFIFSKKKALPVLKENQKQESKKNNKMALEAYRCWNSKEKKCGLKDNKKTVCAYCEKFYGEKMMSLFPD